MEYTASVLPALRQQHGAHFCIVNGENAHQGKGLNEVLCKRLFKGGADVITGGDHSFDKHLIFPYMAKERRLLRPMNYPRGVPGSGFGIYEVPELAGVKLAVLNLRGQVFFNNPIQCPFRTADWALGETKRETPLVFVDFHAEATAEKASMGHYLDGRASVVAGTHTHVQTADESILPGGTGFITDAGATAPGDSSIGMNKQVALQRFLLQIPQKYELATGPIALRGIVAEIDIETGKCLRIERIRSDETLAQYTERQARQMATPPEAA